MSIDEIFEENTVAYTKKEDVLDLDTVVVNTHKVKQQLLAALESCKPEERVATMVIGCPYCHRNFPTNEEEYNVGVNEYHSNIRKLFEVENV